MKRRKNKPPSHPLSHIAPGDCDCTIFFDGACEPRNPGGTATYGFILDRGNGVYNEGMGVVCRGEGATNNVAEWAALENALLKLRQEGFRGTLDIYDDSMLVVNQLSGSWRCHKSHLAEARDRCLSILSQIAPDQRWRVSWIPREENTAADELSKRAYYSQLPTSRLKRTDAT